MSEKQSKLAALGFWAATSAMSASKMEDDFAAEKSRRYGLTNMTHGVAEYTYDGFGHNHVRKTQLTKSQAKKRKASKSAGKARKNNR